MTIVSNPTVKITRGQFEDVLFNPDLVVVQKDVNGHLSHTSYVYVYENDKPVYCVVREISDEGIEFWKETW